MTIIHAKFGDSSDPHLTGRARCLGCKHEWEAVAPVGPVQLECPACGLVRGRFIYNVMHDGDHWHCKCGNDLFRIMPDGTYCHACGTWQEFPW